MPFGDKNMPILDVDMSQQTQQQFGQRRIVNWNAVNYADVYPSQNGQSFEKIELNFNNGTKADITGPSACDQFINQLNMLGRQYSDLGTQQLRDTKEHQYAGAGTPSGKSTT